MARGRKTGGRQKGVRNRATAAITTFPRRSGRCPCSRKENADRRARRHPSKPSDMGGCASRIERQFAVFLDGLRRLPMPQPRSHGRQITIGSGRVPRQVWARRHRALRVIAIGRLGCGPACRAKGCRGDHGAIMGRSCADQWAMPRRSTGVILPAAPRPGRSGRA